MRRTRRNISRALRGLTVAFAAAAALAGTAVAASLNVTPEGYAPALEAEQALIEQGRAGRQALLQAGLTFDYQPPSTGFVGVTKPDGYQPQAHTAPATVVAASSDGLEVSDAALGFGFGLALAAALGISLLLARGRATAAHS